MVQRHIFRIVIALAFGCRLASADPAKDSSKTNLLQKDGAVTIEYIAHACFRVTSPSGKQILLDPYASRVWLGYDFPPNLHADAILISHPHYDHDGGEAMRRSVPWSKTTLVLRAGRESFLTRGRFGASLRRRHGRNAGAKSGWRRRGGSEESRSPAKRGSHKGREE